MDGQPWQTLDDCDLEATLERAWHECHEAGHLFRYRLHIERQRILDGKLEFLLQLNTKRATERRKPQNFQINEPFDPERFHFNRVQQGEVLLELLVGETPVSFLINNSPLTRTHTLLVPWRDRNLPQQLTRDGLLAMVDILNRLPDRRYRIGYNSPGALASVNHLHLHLMHVDHPLYVERAQLLPVRGPLYRLPDDCPVRAYCFRLEAPNQRGRFVDDVLLLVDALTGRGIAHNVFLTRDVVGALRIYIYPRKRQASNKEVQTFNVAFSELSGYVPVASVAEYETLTEARIGQLFAEAQGVDVYDVLADEVQRLW